MSKLTDWGENKVADFYRSQGSAWLPASWYIVPGNAASDSSFSEITGKGIGRTAVSRSLTTWKSTQGDNLASTGTSKATENTSVIVLGAPTGTDSITQLGLSDSASGGNIFAWVDLATPIPIASGIPASVSIPAGTIKLQFGRLGGMTYYMSNKMIDLLFRGQAFSMPSPLGLSYFTAAPTDAGGGTEASGGAYARISLTPSMANISGTQAFGTVVASSGTGGIIANNNVLTHPSPTANQGDMVETGVHDATTAGNLLWHAPLGTSVPVINGGAAPYYPANTWQITVA